MYYDQRKADNKQKIEEYPRTAQNTISQKTQKTARGAELSFSTLFHFSIINVIALLKKKKKIMNGE